MERWAGRAVLALIAAIFAVQVVWLANHGRELRPLSLGDAAPSVALPIIGGGGTRSLADLRGKVVLVDFWATWCKPCEMTIPMQRRLYEKYAGQGFDVLSLNQDQGDDVEAHVAAYAGRMELPFPIVHDSGLAAQAYGVGSLPTMLIVDRNGKIRRVEIGVRSISSLESALDETIRLALSN